MKSRVFNLPITNGVYRNTDGEALSDRNYQLYDGYLDELLYHVKRPGLLCLGDLGLGTNFPITGLFWWPHKSYCLAVSGGNIYKVEYSGGTFSKTDLAGTDLASGETVSFTTDGTYAFLAAGGSIIYTDGSTAPAAIADADCPTSVTHVAWIDGYLLAINGTNKFYHADLNTPLSWNAGSYFSAVGDADNLVSIKVLNREIYLFGSNSLELWENTGSYPSVFQRVAGGFFNVGCIAPHSPVCSDNEMYWLSDKRRFVKLSGGAIVPVSTPYDKEIETMSAVADCVGHRIEIDGKPFLQFQFPTADRTFLLNLLNNTWSEWRKYNSSTGMYERWLGNYYCYASAWGLHLVGSRVDSCIYKMTRDAVDDDGAAIRMSLITGHVDHGVLDRKRCRKLLMRIRRGEGLSDGTEPAMQFRWKDQNKNWSNWHIIGLGKVGEYELVRRVHNLGVYQTRQWEFSVSDSVKCSFGGVQEEVDIL